MDNKYITQFKIERFIGQDVIVNPYYESLAQAGESIATLPYYKVEGSEYFLSNLGPCRWHLKNIMLPCN